ncbi:MAG: catalase, partial [Nitrosomonadales bacterium]|nr:catalase [Nitrosomonadales bacterium]
MNQPSAATAPPLMYDLDDAALEKGAKTNARLQEALLKISQTISKDSSSAPQNIPAKSHGLLRADVEVLDGLPPILVQGIFAKPGTYHAVMRFSSVVSDMVDGNASTPRGLDIKLLGVDGGKLEESEGMLFQDVVLMNGPAFVTSDTHNILGSLRLLAASKNKAPNLKKMLSSVLQ